MADREVRFLQIEVPDSDGGPKKANARVVTITVAFSDRTWTQIKTSTSMRPWPTSDLLDTVKEFVADLNRSQRGS